jgi:TRAP-type transport system periplasmic protein
LFEALRAGKFDGQENPIATIRAAKFDQVQKLPTLSGHAYDPAVFLMSPDVFDELSTEDKAVFTDAAKFGKQAARKFAAESEAAGVAALRQAGMTVQGEIDRQRFASAMQAVMPEFEQRFGRELIEGIRKSALPLPRDRRRQPSRRSRAPPKHWRLRSGISVIRSASPPRSSAARCRRARRRERPSRR